jgi:RNA polymerase sigma factor (sigma-70 family)
VAAAYAESRREEWRSDKRAERHQEALSFEQMSEEEERGKVNSLVKNQREAGSPAIVPDALTMLIEKEDREEHEKMLLKLRSVLSCLTNEQKKIVMLKYVKSMTDTEIGRRLGITRQAVQNRLRKIYAKLRKSF